MSGYSVVSDDSERKKLIDEWLSSIGKPEIPKEGSLFWDYSGGRLWQYCPVLGWVDVTDLYCGTPLTRRRVALSILWRRFKKWMRKLLKH